MNEIWYIIQTITWTSIIDILLVAVIFFLILALVRGTRAVQVLRGALIIVLLVLALTSIAGLPAFGWLIEKTVPAILLSIPVIFPIPSVHDFVRQRSNQLAFQIIDLKTRVRLLRQRK